jgi:hypothetical protein
LSTDLMVIRNPNWFLKVLGKELIMIKERLKSS